MGLFDNWFKGTPKNNPNDIGHSTEAGLKIEPEADGFRLKNVGNSVKHGDTLFVSYQTQGDRWHHMTIEFQKERDGMFVYTGERPRNIVVLTQKDVESALNMREVPRSAYQEQSDRERSDQRRRNDDDDSSSLFSTLYLYDHLNPLSPYYLFNMNTPGSFINHFNNQQNFDSQAPTNERETPPDHHHPAIPHAPISNPFDTNAIPSDLDSLPHGHRDAHGLEGGKGEPGEGNIKLEQDDRGSGVWDSKDEAKADTPLYGTDDGVKSDSFFDTSSTNLESKAY